MEAALPRLRVAVQADVLYRFLHNVEPLRQTCEIQERDQLLQGCKWHVVSVPYTAWSAMFADGASPSGTQLVTGLRRHLEQHTDLVQRIHARPGTSSAALLVLCDCIVACYKVCVVDVTASIPGSLEACGVVGMSSALYAQ